METKETTMTDQKIEKKIIENRWDRSLIVLACFLLFICSVLTGVSVYQGTQRNAKIDHIDSVVTEAKDAAKASEKAVNKAVAASNTPEAKAQSKAIVKALIQIHDIEDLLRQHIDAMNRIYGIQNK